MDKIKMAEYKLAGLCELCGGSLPKSERIRTPASCVNSIEDQEINKECLDYKNFIKHLSV